MKESDEVNQYTDSCVHVHYTLTCYCCVIVIGAVISDLLLGVVTTPYTGFITMATDCGYMDGKSLRIIG